MPEIVLPQIFRKSPDSTTAYDWQDATLNVGYRTYYGACAQDSTVTNHYFLTSRGNIDSSTQMLYTATNASGDLDLDFDITIQKPCDVAAGIAYVNLSVWVEGTSAAQEQTTVTIYHVRGGSETSLGSFAHTNLDPANNVYNRDCFKITTTAKHFATGDVLRVNIVINDAHSGNADVRLYHDPSSALTFTDGAGRTIGTDIVCDIPFRIDI